MMGLQASICQHISELQEEFFETPQNTWKAPGPLKLVGFHITNFSVPSGDGLEENSSVAL